MANLILILNKPQVSNGLDDFTYTVPSGTATQFYSVQVDALVPFNEAINSKVPTATGIGLGTLGFMGAGNGMGLGAGTGGGGQGFVLGDRGTTFGGVGQGFGTGNNYQQPPSAASNATAQSPTNSSLSIVVAKNAVALFTSTAPTGRQYQVKFSTMFSAAAGDVITITATSSASVDNQLSGVTITAALLQGF